MQCESTRGAADGRRKWAILTPPYVMKTKTRGMLGLRFLISLPRYLYIMPPIPPMIVVIRKLPEPMPMPDPPIPASQITTK